MDPRRPCPDSALLAAFLDGTLADYERTAVVSHLAECGECRAVAVTVVEFREVEALDALWDQEAAPVPAPPLDTMSGVTRWARAKTRAPALVLAATGLLAALVVPGSRYHSSSIPSRSAQQAVSTLLDVAEEQRPVEARLSGASAYAPPPLPARRATPDRAPRVQLIATASDIRRTYAHDDTAPSRRAVGVAALLVGDLDEAIATLEIAASGDPADTPIANDLAAAFYERAQRADRPDDLPAALSAVERVLSQTPTSREALFNRALIITALGLRREAEAAWHAYIAQDSQSPWTHEARERLQRVRPAAERTDWGTLRTALESNITAVDVEAAVRDHTSAAREYVENELLPRVITALEGGAGTEYAAVLRRLRTLAGAFSRVAGDDLYTDCVTALERATGRDDTARFITAHNVFRDGMQLSAGQSYAAALPVLQRANSELTAVGSPLAARAQIEWAASLFYSMRYKEAAAILSAVKRRAREHRHSIFVSRAAWLEGMTAFLSNDFALARSSYEEMLSSASAAGDIDIWVMAKSLLANLHDVLGDSQRAWRHRVEAAPRLDDVVGQAPRTSFLAGAAGDSVIAERHSAALLFQSRLLGVTQQAPSNEVQLRLQRARSLFHLRRIAEAEDELSRARSRLNAIANADTRLRVEADVWSAEAEVWRNSDPPRALAAARRLLESPFTASDSLRRARAHLQLGELMLVNGDVRAAEQTVREGLVALDAFAASIPSEFAIRASDPVWRLYGKASELALRRGDLSSAFEYAERGRLRTADERRLLSKRLPSLQDLQDSLPVDTALLMLSQGDDQVHVWVIHRHKVTTHTAEITPVRGAALIANHLREIMRGGEAPRSSGQLFDALFRPVSSALTNVTNLVIVTDAPYDRVAFAALWDRRRDRYFVEDHQVLVSPSATAYAHARSLNANPASASQRRAAFITAPNVEAAITRSAPAAQTLLTAYGAGRLRRYDAATASDLSREVADVDIVHVAAHVVANDRFPGLSQIHLADDPGVKYSGSMLAREVGSSQPLRAQLVALEQGANNPLAPLNEGTLGLARTLLNAGVATVVSPVVSVEMATVEQTWLAFHRHYASGTAAAESLRRAQLMALNESNRRPGPWATLTVFGSAQ